MKRIVSVLSLLICFVTNASSQELNAKVKVLSTAIANADKQIFQTMEKSITDFLNTRKWTTDEYGVNEKIEINILLNLMSRNADDIYTASITVTSSRPVFNSGYTSPTINYQDKDVSFKYSQFTPIQFDDNRVVSSDAMSSNLTAILAFYAYIVIGLDYDSFAQDAGTVYFKKSTKYCEQCT